MEKMATLNSNGQIEERSVFDIRNNSKNVLIQTSHIFGCNTIEEFIKEINALGSVSNLPMVITRTSPLITDTRQYYRINYYKTLL